MVGQGQLSAGRKAFKSPGRGRGEASPTTTPKWSANRSPAKDNSSCKSLQDTSGSSPRITSPPGRGGRVASGRGRGGNVGGRGQPQIEDQDPMHEPVGDPGGPSLLQENILDLMRHMQLTPDENIRRQTALKRVRDATFKAFPQVMPGSWNMERLSASSFTRQQYSVN